MSKRAAPEPGSALGALSWGGSSADIPVNDQQKHNGAVFVPLTASRWYKSVPEPGIIMLLGFNLTHHENKTEDPVNQTDNGHGEEKLRVQVAPRSCRHGNTEAKRFSTPQKNIKKVWIWGLSFTL